MTDIKEKFDLYRNLIKEVQDSSGFIESHECDSLLFTGLVGCVSGISPNIDDAFGSDGRWYRRPTNCSCYPVGSASTISRDMFIGLLWYAYHNKRLDITEQLIDYAFKHKLIMGEAKDWKTKYSRCLMTPGLLATAAWISYKLGGPSRWWLRWIPADFGGKLQGFQAHLQMLHLLLRKQLSGKHGILATRTIKYQFKRQPNNALFAFVAGKIIRSIRLLQSELWWPEDRLPQASDRKAQWLFQRDYGNDWRPDYGNDHKHSGGDFLFLYGLIYKKLKS